MRKRKSHIVPILRYISTGFILLAYLTRLETKLTRKKANIPIIHAIEIVLMWPVYVAAIIFKLVIFH